MYGINLHASFLNYSTGKRARNGEGRRRRRRFIP